MRRMSTRQGLFFYCLCFTLFFYLSIFETSQAKMVWLSSTNTAIPINNSPFPQVNIQKQLQPNLNNTLSTCLSELCIISDHFLLSSPIPQADNNIPDATYRYGSTQKNKRILHHGIDLKNDLDTPVLAAEDGVVIVAGKDDERAYAPQTNFYGQLVVIRHDIPKLNKPLYSLYGHLNQIQVKLGEKVKKGQPIGSVGMSGIAIGYHLHFEVRYAKNEYDHTRNPELWLTPPLDHNGNPSGALAGRIIDKNNQPVHINRFVLTPINNEPASSLPIYFNSYEDINLNNDANINKPTSIPAGSLPLGRDDTLQENFAISGLKAGKYILAFTAKKVYKIEIEIFANKLTFVNTTVE